MKNFIFLSLIILLISTVYSQDIVYIGNSESDLFETRWPINYLFAKSLTQTIYLDEEIPLSGNITELQYRFFHSPETPPTYGLPIQIYMRHTTQSDFPNTSSWVPMDDEWVLVYNAPLAFWGVGTIHVNIPLQPSFNYQGGNIVIMMVKNDDSIQSGNTWQNTVPTTNRSLIVRRDSLSEDLDPWNLPVGNTAFTRYPNIYLFFSEEENEIAYPAENVVLVASSAGANITWDAPDGNPYGYNLHRAKASEAEYEYQWEPIYSGLTETNYYDTTWSYLPEDLQSYVYIVIAEYSGGLLSEPAFSNEYRRIADGLVYIGDPESDLYDTRWPINYSFAKSLTQTIYLDNEINLSGTISELQYNINRNANNPPTQNLPVQIYMRHTNQADFQNTSAWVPMDNEWVLVYNAPIFFSDSGIIPVRIPLNQPFEYNGGNLVIMMVKNDDSIQPANPWQNSVPQTNRSLILRRDSFSDDVDPWNLTPGNTAFTRYPNIFMNFNADMGSLSGAVTSGGHPLADALITIEGASKTAITNSQGQFMIDYIFEGLYTVLVSKEGYQTLSVYDVEIISLENTNLNIALDIETPSVVSGVIIASDTLTPIQGAFLNITGFVNIGPVMSDINGEFSIPVFTGQTYNLSITKQKYFTIEMLLEIGVENHDLGNIIMHEQTFPPQSVTAIKDETSAVDIIWEAPVIPEPGEVILTHLVGNYDDLQIWGWDGEPFEIEAYHRFTPAQIVSSGVAYASLTSISFRPFDNEPELYNYASVEYRIRVYTGGSGYPLVPGNLEVDQIVPSSQIQLRAWNTIELDNPVLIDPGKEIWIGWYAKQPHPDGGFLISSQGQSSVAEGDVFRINKFNDGNFTTATELGYNRTFFIRATAVVNRTADLRSAHRTADLRSALYQRRPAVDVAIGDRRYGTSSRSVSRKK